MLETQKEKEADDTSPERSTWALMEAPGRRFLEWVARYWYILLPALFLCAALPALGVRPYRFEEGRRVAQVLAFLDGGSWLRLEIFGESYANKPPLLPWLIALAAKALGHIDEFAARLPGVIAIASTILTAGLMALFAADRKPYLAALAAGTFVMTAPVVLGRIRLAETDSTATAFAAAAFLIWAASRLRNGGRVGFPAWCGISLCFAATLLAKGPPPLLFPLVPMAIIPLREKRWDQLAGLATALVAASLPLAYWLFSNLDVTSTTHLSREMRLQPTGVDGFGSYLVRLPETFVSGVLQFLPAIVLGFLWIRKKSSWRPTSDWLDHALFLFAVPASVLLLFWPTSEARYIMPALWPLSVMAGLLMANRWESIGMSTLLFTTLVVFVAIEAVYLAREGRTAGQAADRQAANALTAAFAPLPPDRVLIWTASKKPDYNLYVYMERNATLVAGDTLTCGIETPYLLADDDRADLINPAVWAKLTEVEGAHMTLYQRQAPGC